jgi:pimeloyl-ACP methyl ester carboxylesterase
MKTVTSADGTTIAYETIGTGPSLIIVDGALCRREMGPSRDLAKELADRFTVHIYDRRGRGASTDATDFAVSREVDDIAALIDAAGGSAYVLGISSGAALALEAARRDLPITRLAVFEAPFVLDDSRPPVAANMPQQVRAMVDDGKRGEAVRAFMRTVGAPAFAVAIMRLLPVWKKLTGVAHTLYYDLSIVVPFEQCQPLPDGYYADVRVPTLVIDGGKSPQWMRDAQHAIAAAVPGATHRSLPGQTHMVKAKVITPVVADYFLDTATQPAV